MGFFDLFRKKENHTPQAEAPRTEAPAVSDGGAERAPQVPDAESHGLETGLERTKTGLFAKLARAVAGRTTVDAAVLDDLEEVLITSDVGVDTTVKIIGRIEERVARDKYMNTAELNSILRGEVVRLLEEAHGSEENFGLDAREGEPYVVMVVGVNGAGKTTMIKLLCGFYRPDSGQILIGGEDIGNFRKKDLLRLFSAVFQDIYIPPFSVLESVSMREQEKTDRARAENCLRKVGLWEKISSCEAGMDTPMTREIEEGIVLSGGEQQKLLMARALYKDAPILILDEPTAALDPIAESRTYEQFQEMASDKTAIYISHRLASTRFCDRICFLSGGRIAEEGTHEELMKKDGAYREMFLLQSKYYRDGKEEMEDAES